MIAGYTSLSTPRGGVQAGNFECYAGPASTKTSASGRCIAASGYLWINGTRHEVGSDPWVGHCG